MKCLVCTPPRDLRLESPEDGPRVRICPNCGGRWLRSDDYWRWRSSAADGGAGEASTGGEGGAVTEPEEPADLELRFCPEDDYLLARFEVGPPHAFTLDQCRNCAGVWLDAGEWDALLRGGLATQLHQILSAEWQDRIRAARRQEQQFEWWRRHLGEEDLARIAGIKDWLNDHPKRSELYAFLRIHERSV